MLAGPCAESVAISFTALGLTTIAGGLLVVVRRKRPQVSHPARVQAGQAGAAGGPAP